MVTMLPSELPENVDYSLVVFDTETSRLHPDDGGRVATVSVAYRVDGVEHAYAFPFDQGQRPGKPGSKLTLFDLWDPNLPESEWVALLDWLEGKRLVAHNFKFDCMHMRVGTREWEGRDLQQWFAWDTMIVQWILDPTFSSGLKETATRQWGIPDTERKALGPFLGPKTDPRYDLVPWDVMEPYAKQDGVLTLRLYEEQQERLDGGEGYHWSTIEREFQVMNVLYLMEWRGIGYDVETSRREQAKAQKLLTTITGRLPFRPTPDEARKWFTRQGAIPHCPSTAKGNKLSVAECCVRTFINQGIAGAEDWASYVKVQHSIGKYYQGFADSCGADGRLRTEFRQNGTRTMRFSSQRNNLQALPHDYRMERVEGVAPPRSLFHPRPGAKLYEFDLAQAELRVGAKVARCQRMLDLIDEGADIHGDTAKQLFGVEEDSPLWFERRQVSKRANFGLIYNIGPDTFMKDVEKQTGVVISRAESERIVGGWRKLYPEFPRINRKAEARAKSRGYIKLVSGRQRYFAPYEELHKAFNAKIQGDIAEFIKMAMVELEAQWPGILLLQIHDSMVCEIPVEPWMDPAPQDISDWLGQFATKVFDVLMQSDYKEWK